MRQQIKTLDRMDAAEIQDESSLGIDSEPPQRRNRIGTEDCLGVHAIGRERHWRAEPPRRQRRRFMCGRGMKERGSLEIAPFEHEKGRGFPGRPNRERLRFEHPSRRNHVSDGSAPRRGRRLPGRPVPEPVDMHDVVAADFSLERRAETWRTPRPGWPANGKIPRLHTVIYPRCTDGCRQRLAGAVRGSGHDLHIHAGSAERLA